MKQRKGARLLSGLLAAFAVYGTLLATPQRAAALTRAEKPEVTDTMTAETIRMIPSGYGYYDATDRTGKPDRNGAYMTVDVEISSPVPRSPKESVTFRAIIPLEGGRTEVLGNIGNAASFDKFYTTPSLAEVYGKPQPKIDRRGYSLTELTSWAVWYASNEGSKVRLYSHLPPFLSPARAAQAAAAGYPTEAPRARPQMTKEGMAFMAQINAAADHLLSGRRGPSQPEGNKSKPAAGARKPEGIPAHRAMTNEF